MRVGIIDGFSSGANLARAFVSAGNECVSILSASTIPEVYRSSYDPSVFSAEVSAQEAARLGLEAVVPGAETGVELADRLSEYLDLPTNGTRLSGARRSKHLMIQCLSAAGVQVAEHDVACDYLAAVRVADKIGYPVVVKPENSAGADGVTVCHSSSEVQVAAKRLLGLTNQLGLLNKRVVVQEFLIGEEYIVNTVSISDHTVVCDVWRCRKELLEGYGMLSCLEELVASDSPEAERLIAYSAQVAEALHIRYGPAHFEIMLTAKGPVLIEVGSRVQGSTNPKSIQRAMGGSDQVSLTVEAVTDPVTFRRRQAQSVCKWMYHAFILIPSSGVLAATPGIDALRQIPTYSHHQLRANLGDSVTRTTGLFTSLGFVDFIGADRVQLETDYRRFRALESNGLFSIE